MGYLQARVHTMMLYLWFIDSLSVHTDSQEMVSFLFYAQFIIEYIHRVMYWTEFDWNCSFCLFIFFVLFDFETGSLWSPGCPATYSLEKDGLKLIEINLPLPPRCCEERPCTTISLHHAHLATTTFFKGQIQKYSKWELEEGVNSDKIREILHSHLRLGLLSYLRSDWETWLPEIWRKTSTACSFII